MFAVLESAFSHGEMMIPVCSDIDEVNVITLAKLFISLLATIDSSRRKACTTQIFLTSFSTHGLIIAKSHDLHAGDVSETRHCPRATHSKTYEAHSNSVERSTTKLQHTLLALHTLRLVEDNHPIDNIIAYTRLIKWLILTSCHRAYR
jgi:hypothetical protein